MKKYLIFLQGLMLSISANALNLVVDLRIMSDNSKVARIAGEGTGTCIQARGTDQPAGEGTGTCLQTSRSENAKIELRELQIINQSSSDNSLIARKNLVQKLNQISEESQDQ